VVGDHHGNPGVLEPGPAQFVHRALLAEQALDGGRAEGDDDFGRDEADLLFEPGQAGGHFGGPGLAVAGRAGRHVGPAFQDVGDVNRVAAESHRLDDFREQLPGFADERLALAILIGAGRLADKHEFGAGIANTENDLAARRGEVRALDAPQRGIAQFVERPGPARDQRRRGGVHHGNGPFGHFSPFGRFTCRSARPSRDRLKPRKCASRCRGWRGQAVVEGAEQREGGIDGGFQAIHCLKSAAPARAERAENPAGSAR